LISAAKATVFCVDIVTSRALPDLSNMKSESACMTSYARPGAAAVTE
jgi:hypothetical protein